MLRSWRPSKEVPKPRPEKVPKKCFGKCRSETGCRGKCRKKCSGPRAYVEVVWETGPGAPLSALSSAPRFGPALPKHLFGTFHGRGFGTFLDGRQDRNSNGRTCGIKKSTTAEQSRTCSKATQGFFDRRDRLTSQPRPHGIAPILCYPEEGGWHINTDITDHSQFIHWKARLQRVRRMMIMVDFLQVPLPLALRLAISYFALHKSTTSASLRIVPLVGFMQFQEEEQEEIPAIVLQWQANTFVVNKVVLHKLTDADHTSSQHRIRCAMYHLQECL